MADTSSFFDWYGATVPVSVALAISILDEELSERAKQATAYPNSPYKMATSWVDPLTGEVLCKLMWGGHNPHPFVQATGEGDPGLIAEILKRRIPDHRVARCDCSVDLSAPGLIYAARDMLVDIGRRYRIEPDYRGRSLELPRRHDEKLGTTIYLGSPTSPVRLRVYEKCWELYAKSGYRDRGLIAVEEWANTVRFEVQFRPEKRPEKEACALWPSASVGWGVRAWTQEVARNLLSVEADRVMVRKKKTSVLDRRVLEMLRQYGPTMEEVVQQRGWEGLMDVIRTGLGEEVGYEPVASQRALRGI